ncbi:NAD(P)-binding protein [Penicillium mononematosum]|uniref:NAD(P)-binding protein n=1 Tax=Penicillium mononematosum TaxID=268346 RepID=UPI0025468832|nr:NAD(P)-binding protein [Penicillium mononematosum]KAJ6190374.1 NAD(P)-binding protein [Penicillium mononematosum]
MGLQGKIAIVTGASGGIGRAISMKLSNAGCVVICGDIQETTKDDTSSTHESIIQQGGIAEFLTLDVTNAEHVENAVKYAVERFGRLDIMVNNAGVAWEGKDPKPIWDFPQDTWDKDIAINSTGVFLGCKYATAQMIKQSPLACGDRGWILNLSSVFGLQGSVLLAGYVASKHAVMGITKAAALRLCPSSHTYTDTAFISSLSADERSVAERLHPFRGLGRAEDIANAALFLVSEENSWISGVGLPVDGGYTTM